MSLMIAFGAAAACLLLLDGTWLWMMAATYKRLLGEAMVDQIRLGPAAAFYVLYLVGLIALIVEPALEQSQDYATIATKAALFGLVAYGTYALTNYATLKVYGAELAAMDLCWGPVLTAVTAVVAAAAARFAAS